jgi:hypothetical protein
MASTVVSLAASPTKNAEADATARLLDAGKLKIYSGSVPANADASIGGATLLATLTFANPSGSASSAGVFTAGSITADTDAVAGTAAFFRATKSDGTIVMQGSVGATGSGEACTLASTTITAHQTVSATAFTYTRP